MTESFNENLRRIKKIFSPLDAEGKYRALIDLGRKLAPYPEALKTPDRIVKGCQSTLYLTAHLDQGKLLFSASCDALISAGLAALLILAYSGQTPETILKCPPTFLTELGIADSLSPNRSNGLYQIHLRMKQEALKALLATTN